MDKTKKTAFMIMLSVLLVSGGMIVGINWNRWFGNESVPVDIDDSADDYTGNKETYTGKKNTDTIDIPGFDVMNLKADTKEQSVNLYNPGQNTCYFKMSIYMNDGTKIWESKYVEPNKAIYKITLDKALAAGTYENCILKYECFTMDDSLTPLNGSEIKFTMKVLN